MSCITYYAYVVSVTHTAKKGGTTVPPFLAFRMSFILLLQILPGSLADLRCNRA